jgi:hypothetical protein
MAEEKSMIGLVARLGHNVLLAAMAMLSITLLIALI